MVKNPPANAGDLRGAGLYLADKDGAGVLGSMCELLQRERGCLVKAMVFPVFMYGCESWTVKKAEH